jgi:hypothetical protein
MVLTFSYIFLSVYHEWWLGDRIAHLIIPQDVDLAALLTPCLVQSKAPTNVNPILPLTGDDIGGQTFSPLARVASTSNFVSASTVPARRHR